MLMSFLQLYQDRLSALVNLFAGHALVLAALCSLASLCAGRSPLYITATIALVFKAIVIR